MANPDPVWGEYNTVLSYEASSTYAAYLLGPPFAGWIVHILLFGLVLGSVWEYFGTNRFRRDSLRFKLAVITVILLDLLNFGITVEQISHYGISQDRKLPHIFLVRPIDCSTPLLASAVSIIVQALLINRSSGLFINARRLKIGFLAFAFFLCGSAFVMGTVCTAVYLIAAKTANQTLLQPAHITFFANDLFAGWLWAMASADIFTCITLCMLFRKHTSGFSRSTDELMRRLMRLCVRTAAFPALGAVTGAILAVSFETRDIMKANISLVTIYPLSSLYVLSLLSTLRARDESVDHAPTALSYPLSPHLIDSAGLRRPSTAATFAGRDWNRQDVLLSVQSVEEAEEKRQGLEV